MNNLCADIGYKSINHFGEQLCGDHVDIVEQGENSTVIVLAGRTRQRRQGKHSFNSDVKDNFHNDGRGAFA